MKRSNQQNPFRVYGPIALIRLAFHVVLTRITMPTARLVRRPLYLRGRRFISIGAGFTTGVGLRIDALPQGDEPCEILLTIGRDVEVNDYVHIAAVHSVRIGDRVLIASKVFITDHGHGSYKFGPGQSNPMVPPSQRPLSFAPVVIEDDVWIGENVSVLPGVTIGKGSIIGSGSVVTRNVPAYSIALGTPARVMKSWNFERNEWELA